MATRMKPATAPLLAFLESMELNQYVDEIVHATGLWNLHDFVENVVAEDDLSDLKDTSMKKLQIRKLFNKISKKKSTSKGPKELSKHEAMDHVTKRPATPNNGLFSRSLSVPIGRTRSETALSFRAGSTANNLRTVANANGEGHHFEAAVRGVLRARRCPGFRDDVDYRDAVGLETDYMECLQSPVSSRHLLPESQFVGSSHKELQAGVVIYETKLTLAEPQVGHAIGQLHARRDRLMNTSKHEHVHLVVIGAVDPLVDVEPALETLSATYESTGVFFYVTCFNSTAAEHGEGAVRTFCKPNAEDATNNPHLWCRRVGGPRRSSSRSILQSRQALVPLPSIEQKDCVDEAKVNCPSHPKENGTLGHPCTTAPRQPEASEVATPNTHSAVAVGFEESDAGHGRLRLGTVCQSWPDLHESESVQPVKAHNICENATLSSVAHSVPEGVFQHDPCGFDIRLGRQRDGSCLRFEGTETTPTVASDSVKEIETPNSGPSWTEVARGRSFSPKRGREVGMCRGASLKRDLRSTQASTRRLHQPQRTSHEGKLSEFIKKNDVDKRLASDLRSLHTPEQQLIMSLLLDNARNKSAVIAKAVQNIRSGTRRVYPEATEEFEKFITRADVDFSAKNQFRALPPDLQNEVVELVDFSKADNPSAMLFSHCQHVQARANRERKS